LYVINKAAASLSVMPEVHFLIKHYRLLGSKSTAVPLQAWSGPNPDGLEDLQFHNFGFMFERMKRVFDTMVLNKL